MTPLISLVTCSSFNFCTATEGRPGERARELNVTLAPKEASMWNDLTPRRMVSTDGVDILYHFPRFVKSTGVVSSRSIHSPMHSRNNEQSLLTEQLVEFGRSQKLSIGSGADGKGRNKAAAYRKTKGAVVGCCILARVWHGVGHTVLSLLKI